MNPPMNEGRIPQVLDVPSEVWRKKPPHLYPGPRGERFAWSPRLIASCLVASSPPPANRDTGRMVSLKPQMILH